MCHMYPNVCFDCKSSKPYTYVVIIEYVLIDPDLVLGQAEAIGSVDCMTFHLLTLEQHFALIILFSVGLEKTSVSHIQ